MTLVKCDSKGIPFLPPPPTLGPRLYFLCEWLLGISKSPIWLVTYWFSIRRGELNFLQTNKQCYTPVLVPCFGLLPASLPPLCAAHVVALLSRQHQLHRLQQPTGLARQHHLLLPRHQVQLRCCEAPHLGLGQQTAQKVVRNLQELVAFNLNYMSSVFLSTTKSICYSEELI